MYSYLQNNQPEKPMLTTKEMDDARRNYVINILGGPPRIGRGAGRDLQREGPIQVQNTGKLLGTYIHMVGPPLEMLSDEELSSLVTEGRITEETANEVRENRRGGGWGHPPKESGG